jgi:hypothetical protein
MTGDDEMDAKFYVPIIVKDAAGNTLTAQEIYDRRDKLDIDASGGIELANPPISNSGAHKGMIAIKSVGTKSTGTINVELEDNSMMRADLRLNISDERKADDISFSTAPKKYMVAGGENEFKLTVKDQFGDAMKYDAAHNYLIRYTLKATGGDEASLKAVQVGSAERDGDASKYAFAQLDAVGKEATLDMPLAANADDKVTAYDKEFNFYAGAAAKEAVYSLKATLLKADAKGAIEIGGKKYMEVDVVSTQVEVLNPDDSKNSLTYEAYLDESIDNTMIAADDYMGVAKASDVVANYRGFAKEVKVRVMKNGEEVSAPQTIQTVTSNNTKVADVSSMYVAGGDAGTATISVLYTDAKKDMKTASLNVTTKNEGPIVKAIAMKRSSKTVAAADLNKGLYLWDAAMAEKMTVNDQYGGEFVGEGAPGSLNEEGKASDNEFVRVGDAGYDNNKFLNMNYYLTDVAGTNKGGVEVDQNGKVTLTDTAAGAVTSFTVNVMAPSGVQASFSVTLK